MATGKPYRGYYIRPREEGRYGVFSSNGYLVIGRESEEDCIAWIDFAKKTAEQKRDRKRAEQRVRLTNGQN